MTVTRLGDAPPLLNSGLGSTTQVPGGGTAGQVVTSNGSNGAYWGENVARISANGSNAIQGPFVSIAAGSNIVLSNTSNELRIHSTGGSSISAGSNSTRVREISTAGASTTLWSPFDHAHDGIGTITASSSNTMQRGTWNLRPGNGIALALSDTDGDGEFDTTTIVNTVAGSVIPGSQGGGLVFLLEKVASSSATLDFTGFISSTYDDYMFELIDVANATNTVSLVMRVSTDGGSTYVATSSYFWATLFHYPTASGNAGSTSATFMSVADSVDNANQGVAGSIKMHGPALAQYKAFTMNTVRYVASGINVPVHDLSEGLYASTTAVNAVRFLWTAGNISRGTIRVYGISKS